MALKWSCLWWSSDKKLVWWWLWSKQWACKVGRDCLCQDLPAELRNLGSDMSWKQGSAIHFLNVSRCPNSANFCVLCLSAFAHAVSPTWKQSLPLLSDTLLILWPSLYVISCLKFSLVPSGCFNHFLVCASLALCTCLTKDPSLSLCIPTLLHLSPPHLWRTETTS